MCCRRCWTRPSLLGKKVLLVDDVSDSGRTLAMVIRCSPRGADVRSAACTASRAPCRSPTSSGGAPTLDHLPVESLPPVTVSEGASVSVHLIGGGATTGADAPLYAPFVAEAALRAGHAGRARPRVAVISLHPEAEEKAAALGELLARPERDPRSRCT